MQDVRILVADDHRIVREGLKMIVESEPRYRIESEVSDGDELVRQALAIRPDLIVSDLKMPGTSILDSAPRIKSKIDTKILILTAYDDSEDIYRALESGIDGYVMKDTLPEQLLRTMDMVMMGYSCFQPKLNPRRREEDPDVKLTEREMEIFQLIAENLSNQEIARRLYISEATVKTHVSSILRKTGQPNRSQAVLYALKKGFVRIYS